MTTVEPVADQKIWTADELLALSPEERQRLFQERLITDLDRVPPHVLEKVRTFIREHIAENETTDPDDG